MSGSKADEADGVDIFRGVLFGAVGVGFEIGDEQAFGDGLELRWPVIIFTSEEDEVFHAAGFEVAESGAGNAAQIGERGFVAFAGADEEQALSGDAFGIMQEDHFESFAVISPDLASGPILPLVSWSRLERTPEMRSSPSKM